MPVEISNQKLTAAFSKRGGELVSLKDAQGREYLWSGDPAHWSYHSPVLFPFVGKQMGGAFRHGGKEYPMGQHGFARTADFVLQGQGTDRVAFVLRADPGTLEKYPFDFELVNSYQVQDNRLLVSWQVTNPSATDTLYFQIGAHPAFLTPAYGGGKKEDCSIRFPVGRSYRYIRIDLSAGAADPDHVYPLEPDENGRLAIRPGLFDIDTFIFEDGQVEEASLCGPDGKPYLTVRCKGFPYFGIWSPSDAAPFVCLEPWYGRLDDRGFAGDISKKTGIQSLGPGCVFRAGYEIEIC